jgi:hypothetical protein
MTLRLTVCAKKCAYDCADYDTPLDRCYNPSRLFPNDPQWGPYDIRDTIVAKGLYRTFYESTDGSCSGSSESAEVPLQVSVGPMGDPRGCGVFRILPSDKGIMP